MIGDFWIGISLFFPAFIWWFVIRFLDKYLHGGTKIKRFMIVWSAGAGSAMLFNIIDLYLIKENLRSCQDLCGISNFLWMFVIPALYISGVLVVSAGELIKKIRKK